MHNLKTIFTSNIPVECHITKGRLETEGVACFIFDENYVNVDPFGAVAIGGVKLKVSSNYFERAQILLEGIKNGELTDSLGEYELHSFFKKELELQNKMLKIKSEIRNNPILLEDSHKIDENNVSEDILSKILEEEKTFHRLSKRRLNFSMKQFLYELFDFDRDVFRYLRVKPVAHYIEKEIIDNYNNNSPSKSCCTCPDCNSSNVSFGNAIDIKWDIPYLLLSILFYNPFPLIRKKHHCFECGNNFRNH